MFKFVFAKAYDEMFVLKALLKFVPPTNCSNYGKGGLLFDFKLWGREDLSYHCLGPTALMRIGEKSRFLSLGRLSFDTMSMCVITPWLGIASYFLKFQHCQDLNLVFTLARSALSTIHQQEIMNK